MSHLGVGCKSHLFSVLWPLQSLLTKDKDASLTTVDGRTLLCVWHCYLEGNLIDIPHLYSKTATVASLLRSVTPCPSHGLPIVSIVPCVKPNPNPIRKWQVTSVIDLPLFDQSAHFAYLRTVASKVHGFVSMPLLLMTILPKQCRININLGNNSAYL